MTGTNTLPVPSPALEEPSNSSIVKPQTFASFPLFPPEIRQMIWDFTFTPRTLHITTHEGKTPANNWPSAAHPVTFSGQHYKTACVCFTALDHLIEILPPRVHEQEVRHRALPEYKSWAFHAGMKPPPPPGPVALYVCQESREVALKRYQLAFGGTNLQPDTDIEFAAAWRKAGYGEKRIWVDFEIDTIFLTIRRSCCISSKSMLTLLASYAEEEVKKIRLLAIGDDWSYQVRLGYRKPWFLLPGGFKHLTNLKELLVYHIDPFNPSPVRYLNSWKG